MSDFKVKRFRLCKKGVKQLMKSEGVGDVLYSEAKACAARVPAETSTDLYKHGRTRWNASYGTSDKDAIESNALLRAMR